MRVGQCGQYIEWFVQLEGGSVVGNSVNALPALFLESCAQRESSRSVERERSRDSSSIVSPRVILC
eukprot:3388383-Pleurochrysis_carterae.AAC.5